MDKTTSFVKRCPLNELRFQAQERGLTRATTRKGLPAAVERSPVVRIIILVIAILMRIIFCSMIVRRTPMVALAAKGFKLLDLTRNTLWVDGME